ncbi:M23 family metallopeptidase [Pontixanthobacter aestiaquae]|uniref:Peptidoglycan DD-metalloendopeptidase family protein n=1 Tax=Pontixanthobacter aestiaquae TaxID=1509367 RepID=A0A844Z2M3_9SPHN|nr:M23 family metallopeptidase [Pontixanthobacter aestiaquae]MDN3646833.1 M23 family metallopeptidase [Pontixanthobacter aestiaquae]MXO82185.1 peptidoglycan DD-metalloendopeptidase family protein [Pontixanthobacter aestiaquae]
MRIGLGASLFALAGCSGAAIDNPPPAEVGQAELVQPIATEAARAAPAPEPAFVPPPEPVGPTTFLYDGQLTQGGWIRGQAPGGAVSATLGGQALVLDDDGFFFAAFDRDAGPSATLVARLKDGRTIESPLTISPRKWNIERINLARPRGKASEAFMVRRRPELAQINAARKVNADSEGWRQDFIWPVKGRISGRFGSQRIYAGVPGSYHSGIDIAPGNGVPYVAPADGVVTLATKKPFSLEGYLLIIDHGNGLNSAFLHNSKIAVSEGDVVKQGQYIGNIGSTGSATGPHLHWGLKWRNSRLDPLLFVGPMN